MTALADRLRELAQRAANERLYSAERAFAVERLESELVNNLPAILAALDGAEKAREEIRVTDELLESRNELLRAIPECSQHGDQCIPHALDWVRSTVAREASARADAIRECAAVCEDVVSRYHATDYSNICKEAILALLPREGST